jgi:hypothetical protein
MTLIDALWNEDWTPKGEDVDVMAILPPGDFTIQRVIYDRDRAGSITMTIQRRSKPREPESLDVNLAYSWIMRATKPDWLLDGKHPEGPTSYLAEYWLNGAVQPKWGFQTDSLGHGRAFPYHSDEIIVDSPHGSLTYYKWDVKYNSSLVGASCGLPNAFEQFSLAPLEGEEVGMDRIVETVSPAW